MNGTMKYTRRVNLGNYEHKEFTAEISYSVVDEDDYLTQKGVIDRAADLAVEMAETRLGLRPTTTENVASVKEALKAAVVQMPITKEEVEKASKPVAEHVSDQYALAEPGPKPVLRLVEPQPEAVDLPDDDGVVVTVVEPDVSPEDLETGPVMIDSVVEEPEAFDVAAPVDAEITYDDLYNMANGWVTGTDVPGARTRRTTAFQKLMRKYATQLSAIPQDRRSAFVAEFTELQASVA